MFNVNASLKSHSDTWELRGHLSTWRAIEEDSGTRALKHLGNFGTWALREIADLSTLTLEALYLADSEKSGMVSGMVCSPSDN